MPIVALIGTVAFAVAGYLVAVRKRLDLLGVLLVTGLTAVGGGVLRDVLLGQVPRLFRGPALAPTAPAVVILATLAVALATRLHRLTDRRARALYLAADSMGLVAFATAGAHAAIDAGLNGVGVPLLAFVTAVGGGLVRDVLVNEVPALLHEDLYGTVALLVGVALFVLHVAGVPSQVADPAVFLAGLGLRGFAVVTGLRLPRVGEGREP